jgi:hypothetical protein
VIAVHATITQWGGTTPSFEVSTVRSARLASEDVFFFSILWRIRHAMRVTCLEEKATYRRTDDAVNPMKSSLSYASGIGP